MGQDPSPASYAGCLGGALDVWIHGGLQVSSLATLTLDLLYLVEVSKGWRMLQGGAVAA